MGTEILQRSLTVFLWISVPPGPQIYIRTTWVCALLDRQIPRHTHRNSASGGQGGVRKLGSDKC